MPAAELLKNLKDGGEVPVFVGSDNFHTNEKPNNLVTILLLNEKTGDYTTVMLLKDTGVACIISTGFGKLNLGKPV
jgi:DNA polymerase III sliding clamp (beta) subunit (PCNA family)